ncbi:MAG TPA: hypothetical protein DHV36_21695 [Desulfobacteraceae bacterium]|nr:hypothetical protein [Desulfobacteraceae bacterium]|tara:strand:- start:145 stop:423 length:279 start_codon:yes stop_codon:yes gene_type:complete
MDFSKSQKEYRTTCCNRCQKTFQYSYSTVYPRDAELIIKLSCPVCQMALAVDLSPHARPKVIILRSEGKPVENIDMLVVDLPGELQAKERKE